MVIIRLSLALLGSLGFAALLAGSKTKIETDCREAERFAYYSVHGHTSEELLKELKTKGPIDALGKRRFAATDWHVRWRWPMDRSDRAKMEELSVSCSIEIKLPKWEEFDSADARLKNTWSKFIDKLIAHELNHVSFVRELAPKIRSEVVAAKIAKPNLSAGDANEIGYNILGDIRRRDGQYDSETNHGKSEGVVLE